ncbi:MAG: bifunctional isocitrate dehydrogenase kinase/phosphatase [Pseudomonadota bacterium]
MQDKQTQLAIDCATTAHSAFGRYNAEFNAITRRARQRFEQRNWLASQRDQVERIELYQHSIDETVKALRAQAQEFSANESFWAEVKQQYAILTANNLDQEFPKTYFNSLTRKFFDTVGVNRNIEFVSFADNPSEEIPKKVPRNVYRGPDPKLVAREILMDFAFSVPYRNAAHCLHLLADEISQELKSRQQTDDFQHVELIRAVFYQSKKAYLVGRTVTSNQSIPLVIALKNFDGVAIDAVLQDTNAVSILFGFSRTYMHVDLDTVADVVAFLRTILPEKPISELFTVLGRAKQGKTERYRDLFRHLARSEDQFVHAPGTKGMVMIVFTLASYDAVFKVIRDKFAPPKAMRKQDVMNKYQLVFTHDRAGRLVDAQEFRMLEFDLCTFSADVLTELQQEASESIEVQENKLILKHCYIERRIEPLNLYLRRHSHDQAVEAVIDYGQALRDLARSNIFPGDLLLKNFGVTRNNRVIFYDYDELCLLNECNFRDLPKAQNIEQEMQSDTWFFVDQNDVFPEQFVQFLGLPRELLNVFLEHHDELLTAEYWRTLQTRIANGELLEVLPYYRTRTLHRPDEAM